MNKYTFENWKGSETAIESLGKENFPLDSWSLSSIKESIDFPLFFGEVYKGETGEVLGYYGMNIVAGEGYIANIAVATKSQGSGIGNLLMQRLLDVAKRENCGEITLEVRVSNKRAIRLYQKFGFEIEAERKGFYCDGETAYIMWKR